MNLTKSHTVKATVSDSLVKACGQFDLNEALTRIQRKLERAWPMADIVTVETVEHVDTPQIDLVYYDSDGFEYKRTSNDPMHQGLVVEAIVGIV